MNWAHPKKLSNSFGLELCSKRQSQFLPGKNACKMKKFLLVSLIGLSLNASAQTLSQQMAHTSMIIWKDSFSLNDKPARWSYDMGVILKGCERVWLNTGDPVYFEYIKRLMDFYVNEDGSIKDYKPAEYNIDHINNGKLVLLLYRVLGKEKYLKAANLLREQLRTHPRTREGGFWHKGVYPYQMWLDGLYMAEPFYAEYASLVHEDSAFNDITNQFVWMEQHARDAKTGLLCHAWDESKQQEWANKTTGQSPLAWARAMGWYSNAIVDALDWFPPDHPGRNKLISILNRLVTAIEKVQDKKTGLWYDILNYTGPGKEKNYFEASASCQFVYAIAKGVRKGYLPASKISIAQKAYTGIKKEFIKIENGQTNLYGTVSVSGLGGNPYRDGSFEYYMREKVIVNDPKGMGAFINCAGEMEIAGSQKIGKGKKVLLDRYFNSEKKKDAGGTMSFWHYTWEEKANGGFSMFGSIFENNGATISSLDKAPAVADLKGYSVYIIVDPDHTRDNATPNYVTPNNVKAISDWVRAGGTLLLMANDSNNCDLQHFNLLSKAFGISFTNKNLNMVKNDLFVQGEVLPGAGNPVFTTTNKMYLKEISALEVKTPAKALIRKDKDIIFAISKFGKGKVLAVGDPWLYNEYLDGRKLPAEYENYKAARDLVRWLLKK